MRVCTGLGACYGKAYLRVHLISCGLHAHLVPCSLNAVTLFLLPTTRISWPSWIDPFCRSLNKTRTITHLKMSAITLCSASETPGGEWRDEGKPDISAGMAGCCIDWIVCVAHHARCKDTHCPVMLKRSSSDA